MDSFKTIINLWPSVETFADDIGVSLKSAYKMRDRDSISPAHWLRVVHAARKRKISGITFKSLAEVADRRASA